VHFESLAVTGGPEYGVTFFGERAGCYVNRNRYEFHPAGKGAEPVIASSPGISPSSIVAILDCCRTRKLPNAMSIGHRSAQACPAGLQAYEERRTLHFDAQARKCCRCRRPSDRLPRALLCPFG